MPLNKEDISDGVKVFDIIECPICGFDRFTDYGPGGGVHCDECGTQFKVRGTGGDAGCVVDATFEHVHNLLHSTCGKLSYRRALKDLGFYRETRYPHVDPIWCAMRIMKCPDEWGKSLDDRMWCLAPTRYHENPSEASVKIQETLTVPIVGRLGAKEAAEREEREESEREWKRKRAQQRSEAPLKEDDSVHQ